MERNSVKLLEREESRFLHLSSEEVQPWLLLFNQRVNHKDFLSAMADEGASGETVRKMFDEVVVPLMGEMANSIFSRERIQRLVADLKQYRRERFTAGDRATVGHALGAITCLEREDSPGQNSFLLTLCWVSLGDAIKTAVTCPASVPAGGDLLSSTG